MLTSINQKISEHFEIISDKSMKIIMESADKKIRDFDGILQGKPPIITDGRIEINRSPLVFTAFRGIGTIVFSFSENKNQTSMTCEIFPYNNSFHLILLIGIVLLSLWTTAGIIFWNQNSIIILSCGWIIAIVGTYISLVLNKHRLRKYSREIAKELLK